MSAKAAAGGFIAACPCGWHVYSSDRQTAQALESAHRCKEEA